MTGGFEITARDGRTAARCGRLTTAHGVIETPVFMPVGTQATVKSMAPWELRELGAQIILGNTYHLIVRPGLEVLAHAGGLHRFMGWDGPILTDSGGFQVFSLAKLRRIGPDGVEFQSHVDGAAMFLGPAEAMQAQATLGSDIAMVLDECPPWPCDREYACRSVDLSLQWAARCREAVGLASHLSNRQGNNSRTTGTVVPQQLLFGIVQGGVYPDLRERCARELVALGFDGYAIGGVSVGEPEEAMRQQVEQSVPYLPPDRPRYVMGVGTLPQMAAMIAAGIDMFDCVLPTRVARHGTVFTRGGTYSIRNAQYRLDGRPLVEGCTCVACQRFSRAYLRHLAWANEILAHRLLTVHNLHVYLQFMRDARAAIGAGCFAEFRRESDARYVGSEQTDDTEQ